MTRPGDTLPTLRAPNGSRSAPVLVIDCREQNPLQFDRLEAVPGTIYSGDYSVRGLESLFSIERKSPDDLAASLCGSNRDRFERELHRLRGYRFARLLIEGTEFDARSGCYRSSMTPAALLGSLAAFEARYSVPVVWGGDRAACARLVERWAYYFHREILKSATKIQSISPAGRSGT